VEEFGVGVAIARGSREWQSPFRAGMGNGEGRGGRAREFDPSKTLYISTPPQIWGAGGA
jgi:hypothetical protein